MSFETLLTSSPRPKRRRSSENDDPSVRVSSVSSSADRYKRPFWHRTGTELTLPSHLLSHTAKSKNLILRRGKKTNDSRWCQCAFSASYGERLMGVRLPPYSRATTRRSHAIQTC